MVTEKAIRQFINQWGFIRVDHFGPEAERTVRRIVSEMRKEGKIMISVKREPNLRVNIESCTDEEIEAYAQTQIASMGTQYFNTLRPMKQYIKNKALLSMMGGLELMFEEKDGQLEMKLDANE